MGSEKREESIFPFLSLPPELRLKVYEYLTPDPYYRDIEYFCFHDQCYDLPDACWLNPFLHANRQLRHEFYTLLFEKKRMILDLNELSFLHYHSCSRPAFLLGRQSIGIGGFDLSSMEEFKALKFLLSKSSALRHLEIDIDLDHWPPISTAR